MVIWAFSDTVYKLKNDRKILPWKYQMQIAEYFCSSPAQYMQIL